MDATIMPLFHRGWSWRILASPSTLGVKLEFIVDPDGNTSPRSLKGDYTEP